MSRRQIAAKYALHPQIVERQQEELNMVKAKTNLEHLIYLMELALLVACLLYTSRCV